MRNTTATLTLAPCYKAGRLTDVHLSLGRRRTDLLGSEGAEAEIRPMREFLAGRGHSGRAVLPVVLGAGFGHGLEYLLERHDGPVAVLDAEEEVAALVAQAGARERVRNFDNLTWLKGGSQSPQEALARLQALAKAEDARLVPIAHPAYVRLRPELYGQVLRGLKRAGGKAEPKAGSFFWDRARYRKFASWPPRILCITTDYFLMGEVEAALNRLNVPRRHLNLPGKELGCTGFLEELLTAVAEFRPDFVLTINHMGVDREGVLTDLLARLELPLASWFVDNPHLVLDVYAKVVSPLAALFSWDRDNLPSLRKLGFEHVSYLPLGADCHRFSPPEASLPAGHPYHARAGFVGNSMLAKLGHRLKAAKPPRDLLRSYRAVARAFQDSTERSVPEFLRGSHPDLWRSYQGLNDPARQLAYQTALTWESTRRYRLACVEKVMDFDPLVVGDSGWKTALRHRREPWRYHAPVAYYNQLPLLYPACQVNLNATNTQMKGAVNQRVFDVPACGGFVLSDFREQLAELFEPGREAICYHHPDEIPDLVRYYLANPAARSKVAQAGRARVLADHTYEHRLLTLMKRMVRGFGGRLGSRPPSTQKWSAAG